MLRLPPTRRELLQNAAGGFAMIALAGMLAEQEAAADPSASDDPLAPKKPHFPARAKRVIFVYMNGGVFPVRRGARDDEAFITAEAILARGGAVAIYPEGGRSRSGELSERVRPGIGRLVLDTGAPVVPIAIQGSARIRNWKRLRFPAVRVVYGEPVRFEREPGAPRERQQQIADAIFARIRELYGVQ